MIESFLFHPTAPHRDYLFCDASQVVSRIGARPQPCMYARDTASQRRSSQSFHFRQCHGELRDELIVDNRAFGFGRGWPWPRPSLPPYSSSTTLPPPLASVHFVLSRTLKMNEVTSLGISSTAITIANNERRLRRGRARREESP